MRRDGLEPSTSTMRKEEGSIEDASADEVKHETQRNGSTPDPRAAFEDFANEREAILRGLDVLAGLMGCFAAMEERPRQYTADPKARRFERTNAIAEHWRAA